MSQRHRMRGCHRTSLHSSLHLLESAKRRGFVSLEAFENYRTFGSRSIDEKLFHDKRSSVSLKKGLIISHLSDEVAYLVSVRGFLRGAESTFKLFELARTNVRFFAWPSSSPRKSERSAEQVRTEEMTDGTLHEATIAD